MFHENYKCLAAEILLQALRDLEAFPKAKDAEQNCRLFREYGETLYDIEGFLKSGWCETLCEYVGIGYKVYTDDMGELLRRRKKQYEMRTRKNKQKGVL
jgi:hypothetical protein